MSEVNVDTRELRAFVNRLDKAGKNTPANIKKMLKKVGVIVQGKARTYAPRSMTKSQYVSTLKGGKTKQAASKFHPGQLKKSITAEQSKNKVEIGVPSNAPAGKYAEKMHDDRGRSWKELNKFNDPDATDKYIYKAYDDSEGNIEKALDAFLAQLIREI